MKFQFFADKESKQGFWMAMIFMTLATIFAIATEIWF